MGLVGRAGAGGGVRLWLWGSFFWVIVEHSCAYVVGVGVVSPAAAKTAFVPLGAVVLAIAAVEFIVGHGFGFYQGQSSSGRVYWTWRRSRPSGAK